MKSISISAQVPERMRQPMRCLAEKFKAGAEAVIDRVETAAARQACRVFGRYVLPATLVVMATLLGPRLTAQTHQALPSNIPVIHSFSGESGLQPLCGASIAQLTPAPADTLSKSTPGSPVPDAPAAITVSSQSNSSSTAIAGLPPVPTPDSAPSIVKIATGQTDSLALITFSGASYGALALSTVSFVGEFEVACQGRKFEASRVWVAGPHLYVQPSNSAGGDQAYQLSARATLVQVKGKPYTLSITGTPDTMKIEIMLQMADGYAPVWSGVFARRKAPAGSVAYLPVRSSSGWPNANTEAGFLRMDLP